MFNNVSLAISNIFTDNYSLAILLNREFIPLFFNDASVVDHIIYHRHHFLHAGEVLSLTNVLVNDMVEPCILLSVSINEVNVPHVVAMPNG